MRLWALFLAFLIAAPAAAQSPEEQLAAASALFDAHRYAEAAQRLETFLAANPKHAKTGPAALALARSYVDGEPSRGIVRFEELRAFIREHNAAKAAITTLALGLG